MAWLEIESGLSTNVGTVPVSIADNLLTIVDNSDNTKGLQFQLSGITTATTRTLTAPDANTTIVGTDATQTLTNKTLTAPIIATISNTGTLTLPTSTDTLVGKATTDVLTNKTLTTPTIGSFTNATHNHTNAAGGGQITTAALSDYTAPATFTPSYTPSAGSLSLITNTTARWMKIGKQVTIWLVAAFTTSAGCTVGMTIPGSFTAASTTLNLGRANDNGAGFVVASAVCSASATTISLTSTVAGAAFGIGACAWQGVIVLETTA